MNLFGDDSTAFNQDSITSAGLAQAAALDAEAPTAIKPEVHQVATAMKDIATAHSLSPTDAEAFVTPWQTIEQWMRDHCTAED